METRCGTMQESDMLLSGNMAEKSPKNPAPADEETAAATKTVDEKTRSSATPGHLQVVVTPNVPPTPNTEKEAQQYPETSFSSDNSLYEFLEQKEKYRRTLLVLVWIMLVVHLGALQFYAILLGGVFNVVRIAKTHFILWTVVLSIGYGLVVGHVLLHIFRGALFRFGDGRTVWPFWPLVRMKSPQARRVAGHGPAGRSGR